MTRRVPAIALLLPLLLPYVTRAHATIENALQVVVCDPFVGPGESRIRVLRCAPLTMTLSVLDLVRLPSSVVEPVIAGSIVFVTVQNLLFPPPIARVVETRHRVRLRAVSWVGIRGRVA
ncbi:MAG: hypothetical protein M3478_00715 [Planctomycetota bacterium]|nr:hypothetical protein [Planctomycetota bacterium]